MGFVQAGKTLIREEEILEMSLTEYQDDNWGITIIMRNNREHLLLDEDMEKFLKNINVKVDWDALKSDDD
tara:strand:+ start:422 stop:631 length:210 start_codon:yes stop_codon:yes gene_type:complete